MTATPRGVLTVIFVVAWAFSIFWASQIWLGCVPVRVDGRYFDNDHGRYTELTYSQYAEFESKHARYRASGGARPSRPGDARDLGPPPTPTPPTDELAGDSRVIARLS